MHSSAVFASYQMHTFKNTMLGKGAVRVCLIIFSSCKLPFPPISTGFCQLDGFLPDPHLQSFSGYILSLCRHKKAATRPFSVRLQRQSPPNPRSYVTMAIPKLEHGARKEGGA